MKFKVGDMVKVVGNSSANPAGSHVWKIGELCMVVGFCTDGTIEVRRCGRRCLSQWILPEDLELAEG